MITQLNKEIFILLKKKFCLDTSSDLSLSHGLQSIAKDELGKHSSRIQEEEEGSYGHNRSNGEANGLQDYGHCLAGEVSRGAGALCDSMISRKARSQSPLRAISPRDNSYL